MTDEPADGHRYLPGGAARRHALFALGAAVCTVGCEWQRGALDPAVATAIACLRARRGDDAGHSEPPDPSLDRMLRRAVIASTVTSVVILIGLLVASVASGRNLSDLGRDQPLTMPSHQRDSGARHHRTRLSCSSRWAVSKRC
jgi:hypothetical protein